MFSLQNWRIGRSSTTTVRHKARRDPKTARFKNLTLVSTTTSGDEENITMGPPRENHASSSISSTSASSRPSSLKQPLTATKKRRSLKDLTALDPSRRNKRRSLPRKGGKGRKAKRDASREKLEDHYDIVQELGRGHYAVVYLGIHKRTRKKVAIKRIPKSRSSTKKLVNEVRAMQKSGGHQNIVGLYDMFDTKDRLDLVMQLVTGGELFDRLIEKGAYSEHHARGHIRKICEALRFLHQHNITHRDLKPENILLSTNSDDAEVLITDFGLSRLTEGDCNAQMTTICGTWAYCAPEVKDPTRQKHFGYTHKVDLWSLGVIMYVVLSGYHPFDPRGNSKDADIVKRVLRGKYNFKDPAWEGVSSEAIDLIKNLLVVDASKRYDTHQVLSHPWMLRGQVSGPKESGKRPFLPELPCTPLTPKIHKDLKLLKERMADK